MTIAIIAAKSMNNVIGKNGKIPWKIKGEQEQFKKITTGNIVIMGRRTFEEIGHPLPNRKTIVVSTTRKFEDENLTTVSSLNEALEISKDENKDIIIAGGYHLYKEALPLADILYITEVKMKIESGDAFFPYFNEDDYDITLEEIGGVDIKYVRRTYVRKKNRL